MGERAADEAADTDSCNLPRAYGRLILLKRLARGGMGEVFLASTTGIEGAERACVVKTVRRDHIHDSSFVARFFDEARVQSQLNHPGVAQIFEASTDAEGEPYTVVEYVEGRSLSDLRHRAHHNGAQFAWPVAVAIALEIAQALAHVHERSGPDGSPLGIVHRDLSPHNVMIGYSGEVKLIDFGTARGRNRQCHTVSGVVFAKPGYVAPEIARQQIGDGRIDLYALGVILWELCAGRRVAPGDAKDHLEQVAHGNWEVPAIATSIDAPADLDVVIRRLAANCPEDRYPRAALAVAGLAKLLSSAPGSEASERGVRPRIAAWMRKLWPDEPFRSRSDFARLVRDGRASPDSTSRAFVQLVQEQGSNTAPLNYQDPAILPGTGYRLLREIGQGNSSVVHEAEHMGLQRLLTLKLVTPTAAPSTTPIADIFREARMLSRVTHPNIVALYDAGRTTDGRPYLVMERLVGESVAQRLAAQGAIPWRDACSLAIEATRGLDAVHAAAIIHRDITPHNLFMVAGGSLKIIDFGIALTRDEASQPEFRGGSPTTAFSFVGTPEYMAPEQGSAKSLDVRCDIYALGCVLFEMVTGSRLFDGAPHLFGGGKAGSSSYVYARLRASPHVLPATLESVLLRALARDPAARFHSMAEFETALIGVTRRREQQVKLLQRGAVATGASALLLLAGVVIAQQVRPPSTAVDPPASATVAIETPASPEPHGDHASRRSPGASRASRSPKETARLDPF